MSETPVDMPWKRPGSDVWSVSVCRAGTSFHVAPVKGLMTTGNWALNPYHRKGVGNLFAQLWRMFSATYLRREYPRSEKALRQAITECEVYCREENAAEQRAERVLRKVQS